MNTTGAQILKEFDNTAGWLSVFFGGFFCNDLNPSPADLKIKKTNAVIW